MKCFLCSIRSKIWFCVTIALGGYLIATIAGFYTNIRQYENLSHLQVEHYPLASFSSQLLHTFELQTGEYEDAFLVGEQNLVVKANALKSDMLELIEKTLLIVKNSPCSPVLQKEVLTIREDYLAFSDLAEKVYSHTDIENLSREHQKKIQELGQMQGALEKDIRSMSDRFATSLTDNIEQDKKQGLYTVLFLGTLFFTVLLCVAFIVNRVSSKLLITPISKILDNIKRFSLGQSVIEPPATERSDEIGHLAVSFWNLTENLKTTTVSKKYVDNIIHNMSEALLVLKPDMAIQTINQRAIDLFGYREDELIGKQAGLLFASSADDEISASTVKQVIAGGPVQNMNTTCCSKTGRIFPAYFSGSLMSNEADELQGIICVFNDITELKNAEQKLKEMAHYDPLTGLANRNLFFQCLDRALLDAKRHNRVFALLYLDLDKFKPINDTFGHDVGDLVLKEVGGRLNAIVRADDIVARMGGDEFIFLLSGLKEPEDAERVAEKIIQKIIIPFEVDKSSHSLGVSIGISVYPDDGKSTEDLIAQADTAMYLAKEGGGNSFVRSSQVE
ncbi:MAG: sensor domain-containing diguanylate cyclase [Desulfobulbaceae bacterium]|nr:sensor domain-containing diguanylate cyclase [Desulfobulbaceae bacterium]